MNDCACLYGGYDGSDEQFHHLEVRRARKEHQCGECRQTIAVGEKYERYSSKNDGSVFSDKTCQVCAEIRRALYCDGYYFGQLWEDIREQLFPNFNLACVEKLTSTAAKEEITRRYREYLGVDLG